MSSRSCLYVAYVPEIGSAANPSRFAVMSSTHDFASSASALRAAGSFLVPIFFDQTDHIQPVFFAANWSSKRVTVVYPESIASRLSASDSVETTGPSGGGVTLVWSEGGFSTVVEAVTLGWTVEVAVLDPMLSQPGSTPVCQSTTPAIARPTSAPTPARMGTTGDRGAAGTAATCATASGCS